MGNPLQRPARLPATAFPLQDWKGLDLGLIVLLILTGLDVWLGQPVVLTGVFVIAPFPSAMRGARMAAAVLAALTVVLAALSGIWNDNFGDIDYWLRLGLIAAAALFACQAAWVIARSKEAAGQLEEIAQTLQQALRPPAIPKIPGWSIAAAYRPAGSENRVGGDFYDLFRIDDGWMVVIGDVTGHGARAASVTALARYTLRTAGSMTGSPVEALAQLNEALLARPGNSLCSVAAITLDQPALGTVKVAIAGHPRPILIDGSEIAEVDPVGPVLGAFADAAWTLEEIEVRPQQQLFIYTDGVTEASESSQRFGEQRLHRSLSGASDPALVIESVDRALQDFCHGNLDDDAAFVSLMRLEPARAAEGSAHGLSDTV